MSLGARALLGAPGIATRNKKLLGAPGIATRSKDAFFGFPSRFASLCGSILGLPAHQRRHPHSLHLVRLVPGYMPLMAKSCPQDVFNVLPLVASLFLVVFNVFSSVFDVLFSCPLSVKSLEFLTCCLCGLLRFCWTKLSSLLVHGSHAALGHHKGPRLSQNDELKQRKHQTRHAKPVGSACSTRSA